MKWYNLIFFHVFKRYYKNGKFKNDIPWLTATGIVGMATFFYLVFIYILFYYFIFKKSPEAPNKLPFIISGFIVLVANCFWFIGNKRYLTIYEMYKEKYRNDKITEVLSWIFVVLAIPIFMITVLLLRT